MWEPTNGVNLFGINRKTLKRSSNLEIMFYGFPREKKHIWVNSKKDGLVHSFKVHYCLPNNTVILVLLIILNQIQYWSILTS
jgi:hypothetical protein